MKLNYNNNIQKNSIINLIYLFAICAFVGWIGEEISLSIIFNKLVKRGILYGPMCSIYGFAGIILYFLFINVRKTKKNIIPIFIISSFVLGSFELTSGLFFKYIFNIEMWNYHGQYLSILDYTTIPMIIFWGILGTLYVYFIQSWFFKLILQIPKKYKNIIAYIMVITYLIDFSFSVHNIIINPNVLYNLVNIEK